MSSLKKEEKKSGKTIKKDEKGLKPEEGNKAVLGGING